ncbi:hypothetical protein KEM55_003075 [Ascosphaera atra]|nr:hypothetical protein KEM55_003075 [Ascosphaera atra]
MPRMYQKLSRPSSGASGSGRRATSGGTPNVSQPTSENRREGRTQGKTAFPPARDRARVKASPLSHRRNEIRSGDKSDNNDDEVQYLGTRRAEVEDSGDEYGRLVMLGAWGTPK